MAADNISRADSGRVPREEKNLQEQFIKSLQANLEHVKRVNKNADPGILERIEDLFSQKNLLTWRDFYLIERLLVELYDEISLDIELERKMRDARRVLYKDQLNDFYQNSINRFNAEPEGIERERGKRALLSRLLNDIQWRYTVIYEKRDYGRLIRKKTSFAFIISIIPFLMVSASIYSPMMTAPEYSSMMLMLIASFTGMWGASFSMLISLKKRLENAQLDDLRVLNSYGFIFSRLLIGAGASLILYFFLKSGLLSGNMFPTVTREISEATFALFVVWSFLAGFSETFVPGLLSKTEKGALSEENPLGKQAPQALPQVIPSLPRKPSEKQNNPSSADGEKS